MSALTPTLLMNYTWVYSQRMLERHPKDLLYFELSESFYLELSDHFLKTNVITAASELLTRTYRGIELRIGQTDTPVSIKHKILDRQEKKIMA